MENWKCVYSTEKAYEADLVIDMLKRNDINAVILNEKDSSFVFVGDIDIFVSEKDEAKASKLIKEFESE